MGYVTGFLYRLFEKPKDVVCIKEIYIGRLTKQPIAVVPALHSVCFITPQLTSGLSISTLEIRQNRISAFDLRVVWTSAFKRSYFNNKCVFSKGLSG